MSIVRVDGEIVRQTITVGIQGPPGPNLEGGPTAADQLLIEWTEARAYEITVAAFDADEVPTVATVKWPDGSGGTLTTTVKNPLWFTVDAYTITHTLSGKTVTQSAVTRNGAGNITAKPALTVA